MGRRRIAIALLFGSIATFAACLDFGSISGDDAGGADASADASVGDGAGEAASYVPPATCKQAGYACIAAAAPGWTGPFALYDGDPSAEPSCPSKFPTAVVDHVNADPAATAPAVCSTCTCGASNGTCTSSVGLLTACGNSACATVSFPGNDCTLVAASGISCMLGPSHMTFSSGLQDAGTCVPSPQTPTLPPVTWTRTARGCSPPSVEAIDCASGSVCLAIPDSPFHSSGCISHDGDVSCPADSPYTDKRVFYSTVDDTRACTACGCGTPTGGNCDITLTRFSDDKCANATTKALDAPPSVCLPFAPGDGTYFTLDSYVDGGSCPASGGKPTGTATPATPTTVCCTP